ncbi:MAG: hypothetical protein M1419_01005 [Bacteroidetes bacterium]|nr:hypothetical protein [Bacteroidota bacterium]
MRLNQDFKEFVELLNYHKVEYLIIGGYAVAYYGYPRYTGDIDIWVNNSVENSKKMVSVVNNFGFSSLNIGEKDFQKKDIVFQLGYPPNRIDILTSVTGLDFNNCYDKRNIYNEGGFEINFIDLENLKVNKKATGRAIDIADIENLP